MKRAVIFAHYDKNNLIDDYVIYYLNALKNIASEIIFVSCSNLKNLEKLEGIVSHVIVEEHDEYDFGSYKRGFLYLQSRLNEFDEIVFANDSCYGPLYSLGEVFDTMEQQNCDFWGITENKTGLKSLENNKYKPVKNRHVQSYFIVFKKKVFMSQIFTDFINSIKHFDNKNDIIINYEIGLSKNLYEEGFVSDCYIKKYQNFGNSMIYFWRPLIKKYKMPFIKCSILRHKNDNRTCSDGWQDLIAKCSNYPISIIENNLGQTLLCSKEPSFFKIFYFNLLAILPSFLKKIFVKFNSKNNF